MNEINTQEILKNKFGLFCYNISKSINWDCFSDIKNRTTEYFNVLGVDYVLFILTTRTLIIEIRNSALD